MYSLMKITSYEDLWIRGDPGWCVCRKIDSRCVDE